MPLSRLHPGGNALLSIKFNSIDFSENIQRILAVFSRVDHSCIAASLAHSANFVSFDLCDRGPRCGKGVIPGFANGLVKSEYSVVSGVRIEGDGVIAYVINATKWL